MGHRCDPSASDCIIILVNIVVRQIDCIGNKVPPNHRLYILSPHAILGQNVGHVLLHLDGISRRRDVGSNLRRVVLVIFADAQIPDQFATRRCVF